MFFPVPVLRQSIRKHLPHASLLPSQVFTRSSWVSVQRAYSAGHAADESFSAFNERYTQFFEGVQDLFELQRGLNNCFAYDLVPAVPTVEAALRVENKGQYQAYLNELKPLRDELGVPTKEEMYGQAI
ncbi:uncharacterized protein VP01_359g9 [Puccinia sorghi]|uniref:Cytochrome c oxidase subunit 6, mitochondrial n=1 Tax=Puccinia sorghi TaxID=27349 RepID=A0A0L6UVY9_9BASI|nr:uncharacterized protein VP01_359g9 [Puccinia sorghi]